LHALTLPERGWRYRNNQAIQSGVVGDPFGVNYFRSTKVAAEGDHFSKPKRENTRRQPKLQGGIIVSLLFQAGARGTRLQSQALWASQ